MNSKKIRKRNSIMAVLFVSVLLITLLFTQTTANAGTATSIVKNKTFYIENCGTESYLRFYCQVDKNDSLSGNLDTVTASSASSLGGYNFYWRLPGSNTKLGGTITCYYISSEKKWKIVMTNVNCFTYTPYIYCYAGKIPGKYAAGVISTGTNGNGITANGTYSSVNQTPEFKNNNNFRFYIGAGFDDAGFRFSWGNNQYTMKLNANGGTMSSTYPSSGLKMVYNSTNYYALGYIPTRRGYVFNGYYSAASGGSQVYLSSGACNTNNATYWSKDKKFMYAPSTGNNTTFTLYAHWTPKTYTLKLNGNGGTVPSSYPSSGLKLTYASTNYSSVSSYTPTREGYTFDGWYNSTSGGTKIYNANGSCVTGTTYFNANKQCQYDTTNGATINAYAHWTPKSYTITTKHLKYNPMTNEWDEWRTTTESAKYDTTYEVKHIAADTGYVTFSKDASFVVKGEKTVNAFYYPKQYNVTLDYAGGVDKDNNTKTDDVVNWTYASDNGTDLSKYALTKEGYTFKGWYIDDTLVYDTTNKAVTSEYFKNNLCILNSANGNSYQLTAKWEANPYKINLDYNYKDLGFADETEANLLVNGTNTIIDYIDVTYNEKIGDLPNPSILGASFVGWNTKADKTGDTYTKDTVYTIADDVTLYAIWEVNDFTDAKSCLEGIRIPSG